MTLQSCFIHNGKEWSGIMNGERGSHTKASSIINATCESVRFVEKMQKEFISF